MKTLHIIRHAKSSWNFDFDDHDRPLGIRGRADVFNIARHLSQHIPTPELMITSTASRALYTALFIADEWGYSEDQIVLSPNLYMADSTDILSIVRDQKVNSLAIFGHNPGFTSFINKIQDDYIDNLPTCGVFSIDFNITSWKEIAPAKAKNGLLITPKQLRS